MKETRTFGAVFSPEDVRDYRIACASKSSEFPEEFELSMPAVKDQKDIGSCVAHAISTVVEYYSRYQGDDNSEMSVGYIYGNRRNTSHFEEGMITRLALASTCEYGDVSKVLFPENEEVPCAIDMFEEKVTKLFPKGYPNRFSSYYRCYSESEIKMALMKNGPVIFAIKWRSGNYVNEEGLLIEEGSIDGGHCMVIYGWDKRGWKFQNSWGTAWGINGRAILPYSATIKESWGVVDEISETQRKKKLEELEKSNSDLREQLRLQEEEIKRLKAERDEIKKPYNTAFGQMVAKLINLFINQFKRE